MIPESLLQAIKDDPDRFANYVIDSGEEPSTFKQWVEILEKEFNTPQGNNAIIFISEDENALKTIFEAETNKTFINELKNAGIWKEKRITKAILKETVKELPKPKKEKLKVSEKVKSYDFKFRGKTFKKTTWGTKQKRWLRSRKNTRSNKNLTKQFNETFNVKRSVSSIRDQKLRLKGTKK